MDVLTKSIHQGLFDLQGGIKSLYLFPYVRHSRSLITVSGQELTAFPATEIYKIEGNTISFGEQPSEEKGSWKFTQNLSFVLPK